MHLRLRTRASALDQQVAAVLGAIVLSSCLATAAAAEEPTPDCASDVSDQQGVTAFVSLIDGQPTDPKAPTLNLAASRQNGIVAFQPTVQLAPGSRRGLCDAVLSLQLPPLNISNGQTSFGRTVGVSWEQRWQEDTHRRPTIATLLTATIDYSGPSTLTTIQGTVIAAKTVDRAVFYANASLSGTFGNGAPSGVIPALTLGAKWPARGGKALIADVVLTKGVPTVFELGYQFSGPFDINFGPGVSVSLERRPSVGIGIVIQRDF